MAESHTRQANRFPPTESDARQKWVNAHKTNTAWLITMKSPSPQPLRQNGLCWNDFLCRFLFRILTLPYSLFERSKKVIVFSGNIESLGAQGDDSLLDYRYSTRDLKVFLYTDETQLSYLALHKWHPSLSSTQDADHLTAFQSSSPANSPHRKYREALGKNKY